MEENIWDRGEEADYAGNLLHLALRENGLTLSGGKKRYTARVVSMGTLTKETIVKDVVTLGRNENLDYDTLLRLWDTFEAAAIDRIKRGFRVKGAICEAGLSVRGTFDTKSEEFNAKKHSIVPIFKAGETLLEALSDADVTIVQSGTRAPDITAVRDAESGTDDTLTPGGILVIRGHNIRLAGTSGDVGVYFVNAADGSEVKADSRRVSENRSGRVGVIVPPLEKGTYTVRIVTQYIGSTTVFRKTPLSAEGPHQVTVR